MIKTIRGPHADLRSVRAPDSISLINIEGSRIASFEGIERFGAVRWINFTNARTDDLRALMPLKQQLTRVAIVRPASRTDFASLLGLNRLEALHIYLFDEGDAARATTAPFEQLPHLQELSLLGQDDYGLDMGASWLPELKDIRGVWFGKLGIRDQDTDAVCRASPTLRHLQFRERSAEQTRQIAQAFARGVVDTWEPPEPSHGVIMEIDRTFSVSLSFPRFDNGLDRDIYAERLLEGKWKDLAGDLEMDPDADMIFFSSRRREVLQELVKRATAARLV